jgi:hypothetical protein
MPRLSAYLVIAVCFAALTGVMACLPSRPSVFVVGTLTYAVLNGAAYSAFTAVVLDTIGMGAASTKYNLFTSLAYAPITYVTLIEGHAHDRWGTRGLLWTETCLGAIGVALVAIVSASRSLPAEAAHGAAER